MIETIAFAGSFDPMTNGHLWVIKEALKLVKNIRIIVANNPDKKYMFDANQRKEIIEQIILDENLKHVTVDIVKNDYVASYLTNNNITHIIRGIRNSVDFDQEKLIQRVNSEILGEVQTIFLMPPSDLESVSSSFVKSLIGPTNWPFYIKRFLPSASLNAIYVHRLEKVYNISSDDIIIRNVIKAYQNKNRYYHNMEHIMMMLEMLKNTSHNDILYNLLKFSIFFHDAIYKHDVELKDIVGYINSTSFDNKEYPDEILSSFIVSYMSNIPYKNKKIIEEAIKSTIYSNPVGNTEINNLIRMYDLSILGKPWVIYEDYMKNIRKEYSEYSDEDYSTGRISILTKLIKSFEDGSIFTNYSKENYTKQAIENMNKEISILMK